MPTTTRALGVSIASLIALTALFPSATRVLARAGDTPGGFMESDTSTTVRPRPSAGEIQGFIASRGRFSFPAPYGTEGIRITNAGDCPGSTDCVRPVGYSYWNNLNNHTASNEILIFMTLDRQQGGAGPSLFSYNKTTGETLNRGPLFDSNSPFSWSTGEGWYFSATRPTTLYINNVGGPQLYRFDVLTHAQETVFDATAGFGPNRYIWQIHSSDDDRVHSFTVRDSTSYAVLGCGAYREDTRRFYNFAARGDYDECQVDKSGRFVVIKENVDGRNGEDNVIEDLDTGAEQILLDESGAGGHSDLGFGYMVAEDNFNPLPGAVRLWWLDRSIQDASQGRLVFQTTDWSFGANHVAHSNAISSSADGQYVCSSEVNRQSMPRANEVLCYKLDGTPNALVVAPVMTDLNAPGGGSDDYWKMPKGNLDVTGEYFIWTSNLGGGRMDAIMVHVPVQKLGGSSGGSTPPQPSSDTSAPSVSISSPASGATLSGNVTLKANASDNVGVVGVQFMVDGANAGAEVTTSPYQTVFATATVTDGQHTVSARARDAAGNVSAAPGIAVTISNQASFTSSSVTATKIGNTTATITWKTSAAADSQVVYGTSTAYGSQSTKNTTMSTSHSIVLNNLASGTTYHYRVVSETASGVQGSWGDYTFTTTGKARSSPVSPVTWTSLVNTTASGSSIQKTGGCSGCEDAGALSQEQIASGDGYLEVTIPDVTPLRFIGLGGRNAGTSASEIGWALRVQAGVVEVRENGVYRADTRIAGGDTLRIQITGGVVSYLHNGSVFYTSSRPAAYPMVADTAFYDLGGLISNAVLGAGASPAGTAIVRRK